MVIAKALPILVLAAGVAVGGGAIISAVTVVPPIEKESSSYNDSSAHSEAASSSAPSSQLPSSSDKGADSSKEESGISSADSAFATSSSAEQSSSTTSSGTYFLGKKGSSYPLESYGSEEEARAAFDSYVPIKPKDYGNGDSYYSSVSEWNRVEESDGIYFEPATVKHQYTIGLYPQNKVTDSTLLAELANAELYKNWGYDKYRYKGVFYDKVGDDYYEYAPVTWTRLYNKGGYDYLLCDKFIDGGIFNASYDGLGTVNHYANDYAKSTVHTCVGNLAYRAFFYDTDLVPVLTVDNSSETSGVDFNPYSCANTTDRGFLPSVAELKGLDVFSSKVPITDYAKRNGNSNRAWLRSPSATSSTSAYCYDRNSGEIEEANVELVGLIRPMIAVPENVQDELYACKFYNYDGTPVWETTVRNGKAILFQHEDPTHPSVDIEGGYGAKMKYAFSGWNNITSSVGANTTYIARFQTRLIAGEYPQSKVTDESLISALNATSDIDSKGYRVYDGHKYQPLESDYYLVEPIEWVSIGTQEGGLSFAAAYTLDAGTYSSVGSTYYATSDVRTFLNNTFYDKAFNEDKALTMASNVDNSSAMYESGGSTYSAPNTTDYAFAPSTKEVMKAGSTGYYSDYARARLNMLRSNTSTMFSQNDYWTRCPQSSNRVSIGGPGGYADYVINMDTVYAVLGIRPCVSFHISESGQVL